MRMFDLKGTILALSTPSVISLLNYIELYKGKTLNACKMKKVEELMRVARESEIISSNKVGNVDVGELREKELLEKGAAAKTFQEHMLLGYKNAMELIDSVYKFQPFDRSFICTLHYYIYRDYNPEFGGRFKDTQNYIQEVMPDGSFRTVFVPSAPEESAILLENLLYQFNALAQDEEINKLLLIMVFTLDLLCIHPFNHGNGRLSRLVLYFLLKKYDYDICSYFSLAYLLKSRLSSYIDTFEESVKRWGDNENDYSSYVTFMLKIILEAYKKLDYIEIVNEGNGTASEKVFRVINDSSTPVGKHVITSVLYNTSKATIEKALADLLKEGRIQLITKGRYSKYFRM